MDPRYSSDSSRLRRAMTGNMPGLETAIYHYPTTERGYRNTFVERPTVDPYSSHYELIKLLESSYPSSIDPRTPLKVNFEEDTLVLDAIPVVSSSGGSSSGNNHSRRFAYRSAEDTGSSFVGSKSRGPYSQSSRGKEERRLSHFTFKNNYPMALIEATKNLEALRIACFPTPKSAPVIPKTPASARLIPKTPRLDLVPKKTPSSSSVVLSSDWSPLDDGIMVNLPSNPNNPPTPSEVDSHFQKVLYSPSTRKRLPVFEEIYCL